MNLKTIIRHGREELARQIRESVSASPGMQWLNASSFDPASLISCFENALGTHSSYRKFLTCLEANLPADGTLSQQVRFIMITRRIIGAYCGKVHQNEDFRLLDDAIEHTVLNLIENQERRQDHVLDADQNLIHKLKVVKTDLQNELNAIYQLVKDVPVGMAACSKNLKVTFWNPMAVRLTGYQQADLHNVSVMQILTIPSQTHFQRRLADENKWIYRMKLHIQPKTGTDFPVWLSLSKIRHTGHDDYYYVISFIDIRQQQTIQKQMQRIDQLSAIARFAGAIFHDIRNPINALGLNIEVLEQFLEEDSRIHARYQDLFTRIHRQMAALKTSLNQYLGYARLTELNLEILNLNPKFREYAADVIFQGSNQGITVDIQQPRSELYIKADWIQLQRAVQNLVQNAFDVVGKGGRITLKLQKAGSRIYWSVTDSGPGIQADEVKRLFEPYYSTRPGGTGLGLYIARGIVMNHNGRLTCRSQEGRGTTFRISLPHAEKLSKNA